MIIRLVIVSVCVLIISCTESKTSEDPVNQPQDALDLGLERHGGLDRFRSYSTLEFTLTQGDNSERHIVDLRTRKTRMEGGGYTVGFDGVNAWVHEHGSKYERNPRFYNGLYFYFFAIPFVLADPGANRELLPDSEIDGVSYKPVKVWYDVGTGESANDYYIANFNSDSGLLEFVQYTVTFRSGEPSDNYNAQRYLDWTTVDGLLVPGRLDAYHWDEATSSFGDKRGSSIFTNIEFADTETSPELFDAPDEAVLFPPVELSSDK
ncbi:MAG: hypothetical protein HKN43_06355 [Rhodothermales bacterium]|nr:hypothetical protein [Rhodothermales bacterium]